MKKSFAYPIIFMSLITAIYTFLLAFLDHSTAEQIEFLASADLQKKILYVFDIPVKSQDPEKIDKQFKEKITIKEIDGEKVYLLGENEDVKAFAYPVRGAGLWGSIEAYIGISADYSKLVGIEFISHSETPGLGGRIDEDWYKNQFRGIELKKSKNEYIVYSPSPNANVDAITGATLTSQSVRDIVNVNIGKILEEKKVD
ncbi:FMN-binding protein [Tissierella creatinophila]|uniref:Na(+)-translocating NADH-quinone reductase subunit C n=1 Tax=Tissierella creatinophila DSM 6911 TaxID=1123403 RepID=A0A1U7M644_TISCR|nr:FMN-binding protein [Tissierella creatinophila]OLS02792.1 Na(+)-translocating NADH-quinone reductase subunit C [Tissierella creatinophila DSM 6911]